MITLTGYIKKGKITLSEFVDFIEVKVLVTLLDENPENKGQEVTGFGQRLKKLKVAGLWKNHEIENGLERSKNIRKRIGSRNAD